MTTVTESDETGVLYRGGVIHTVDPEHPRAEAVATRAGRILTVGSEPDCRQALGLGADDSHGVIDLAGRSLLPGFNDAHMHPMAACFFTYHLDLAPAVCLADVLDAIADRARVTPPGEWVIGLRVTVDQLTERRLPLIEELDTAGAGRPVILLLRDGRTSIGNTVALAAAGIAGRKVPPVGGKFVRDNKGRLTGVCEETATGMLLSAIPMPDTNELAGLAKTLFAELTAEGITSVGVVLQTDGEGPAGPAGALESVAMLLLVDHVPQGIHTNLFGQPTKIADLRTSSPLHRPEQNRYLGGMKVLLDGTLGGRTAWLDRPYTDDDTNSGYLRPNLTDVAHRMRAAHRSGLQISLDAIGDAANDCALNLFEALLDSHEHPDGNPPRHRLEHASLLSPTAIKRLADLGIVAVVQPPCLDRERAWLPDRLGPDRLRHAYPFRSMLDAGVIVAGSSDAPLEATDPLIGIHAAVTRYDMVPEEAISAAEAIAMYTRGAAIAQRRDHITGTISEGKRADLVILSDDPTAVPAEEIPDIRVDRTVIGGQVAYRRPGSQAI